MCWCRLDKCSFHPSQMNNFHFPLNILNPSMLSVGLQDSDRLSPQNGAAALHMLGNLRHTFLLQVTRSYPPLLVLWISKIPPQTQYIQEAGLNRWQNVSLFPPLCWLWGRLTALYFYLWFTPAFLLPFGVSRKEATFFCSAALCPLFLNFTDRHGVRGNTKGYITYWQSSI